MVCDGDDPGRTEARRKCASIEVGHRSTDVQYEIGALHKGPYLLVHERTVVDAYVTGMMLIEHRLTHEHGREWESRRVQQGSQVCPVCSAAHQHAGQQARGPGT